MNEKDTEHISSSHVVNEKQSLLYTKVEQKSTAVVIHNGNNEGGTGSERLRLYHFSSNFMSGKGVNIAPKHKMSMGSTHFPPHENAGKKQNTMEATHSFFHSDVIADANTKEWRNEKAKTEKGKKKMKRGGWQKKGRGSSEWSHPISGINCCPVVAHYSNLVC